MKPPICRVCGKAEWNHVCRSSADDVRAAAQPKPRKEVVPDKPKPKFDRNAYQREYMRRRRAKL